MGTQRAVVRGTIANVVQIRNVFTANVVASYSETETDLWQLYLDQLYADVCQILSGQVQFTEAELYFPAAGHWEPYGIITVSHGGGEGGDYLPNAVALVILGLAPGIRHIGRKFFSGIAETFTAANVLSGAAVGYAASVLLDYVSPAVGIGGGALYPGVVDKAGDFHEFTGGVVSSLLGSMRRRKPGSGI